MNNSLNIFHIKKITYPREGFLEFYNFYMHAIQIYLNNNSINLNAI